MFSVLYYKIVKNINGLMYEVPYEIRGFEILAEEESCEIVYDT